MIAWLIAWITLGCLIVIAWGTAAAYTDQKVTTSQTPTMTLKQFLKKLEEHVSTTRSTHPWGEQYAHRGGTKLLLRDSQGSCPLTCLEGRLASYWHECGEKLGLTSKTIKRIVEAADHDASYNPAQKSLREELERICMPQKDPGRR